MTLDYELQEITAEQGPDVAFHGRLIGQYSTRRNKPRWTEYEVWETRAGAWVVVVIGRSEIDGEEDRFKVAIVRGETEQDKVLQAMEAMEWGHGARALAKRLKWNVRVEVE